MIMCRNRNCENFNAESSKHDYCDRCIRMANEVMSNARCVKTGNKPEFEQALRVAEYALRIYQNPYCTREQLDWASMIYPSGWADSFEGATEEEKYDNGTNCAGASKMNSLNQIDYTALYRAYYARRRRWHSGILLWVAAILIEVIIVLIVGAIVFASIVAISRARVENIPMTGIPSIDHGIYPDAHVEEAQQ